MMANTHPIRDSNEIVRVTLDGLVRLNQASSALKFRQAGIRADTGGNYLSRFKGRGMEFDETRLYTPGDDARNLDWRVTARTGKAHTKLFREERERPVFLSVDARSSMFFATRGVFKFVMAARLAALIAWSAQRHSDRVGGQVFSEQGGTELKPEHGRRAVLRLLQELADAQAFAGGLAGEGLDEALARLVRHARPGSLVFIFSDFRGLGPVGEFSLYRLRSHCEVSLVFLYDPLESRLPESGRDRFAQGDRELCINASPQTSAVHSERFAARHGRILELARRHRMRFMTCQTTDDPLAALRNGWSLGQFSR